MPRPKQIFVEKPGNSYDRFEKFVKKVMAVPKEEIDRREAEYQRARKAVKKPA
jgi:hypothetical protein